jgi:hypothetical protein
MIRLCLLSAFLPDLRRRDVLPFEQCIPGFDAKWSGSSYQLHNEIRPYLVLFSYMPMCVESALNRSQRILTQHPSDTRRENQRTVMRELTNHHLSSRHLSEKRCELDGRGYGSAVSPVLGRCFKSGFWGRSAPKCSQAALRLHVYTAQSSRARVASVMTELQLFRRPLESPYP